MAKNGIACIFPVHNEAKILRKQIDRFIAGCKKKKLIIGEIIIVENGSSDNSWKVIQDLRKKYRFINGLKLDQASYGQAMKAGLVQARKKNIFVFNVDFFDEEFISQALKLLSTTDIVIASKTMAASHDQRSIFRRLMTYFFNVFLRLVLNYPGTDTHGIKGFRNTPLLRYTIYRCRTKNELFDTELVIRLTRWGAKLIELPINVWEIRPTRYSLIKRIIYTLSDLLIAIKSKYLIPNFEKRIVVADDFGLNHFVNKNIVKTVKEKVPHYVSILANFVKKPELEKLLRTSSRLKYSIHLNLIEGRSVLPADEIPSLVDDCGYFYPIHQFLPRLLLGLIKPKEVKKELEAQIQKLKKQGVKISHIDSHQHTHLFPPLGNVVMQLIRKYKIDKMRSFDSSRNYLFFKPCRYFVFLLFYLACKLKFGPNRFGNKELDVIIIHPGIDFY